MHKNAYGAKTLIGNWQEERSTQDYRNVHSITAPTLPSSSYSKYVPISKDVGNVKDYEKVSFELALA